MKNNQLTAVLLGLFCLSVVATIVVFYKYSASARKAQQNTVIISVLQSLFNESGEYAKTHPDLQHFLQSAAKAPSNTGAPARPAAPAQPRSR